MPDQLGGGGGGANLAGAPAYGTPRNTSTGSSRRDAGSTIMPRIAPRVKRYYYLKLLFILLTKSVLVPSQNRLLYCLTFELIKVFVQHKNGNRSPKFKSDNTVFSCCTIFSPRLNKAMILLR